MHYPPIWLDIPLINTRSHDRVFNGVRITLDDPNIKSDYRIYHGDHGHGKRSVYLSR